MGLYRPLRFFFLWLLVVGMAGSVVGQSPISFPWNCPKPQSSMPSTPIPTYRTLGKVSGPDVQPQPILLESLPPQEAYAYGWFGSNATYSWHRSFGYSRSFTQWSRN